MKNYEQPALELIRFSAMDVIMASEAFTPGQQGVSNDPLGGL